MNKVTIVNSTDAGGGAENVAMAMVDGFPALGSEAWLAVGHRWHEHPRVVAFSESPHVPQTGLRSPRRAARRTATRLAGIEDFDHPLSRHVLSVAGPPPPDLVFLGNLHGDYFDLRALPELSHRVPVVVRLADSWMFTGHCASPLGCDRWERGCGSCPDLEIPPAISRDATRFNWRRKRSILSRARLAVVSPSQWQLERARRSLLGPAIEAARVVPNGVDLEVFNPDGARADRDALGVPEDSALLVFACNLGATNRYKDLDTIRDALAALGGAGAAIELLVVGHAAPLERLGPAVRIRHLPHTDPERLAELYRAADLYVHSAREETFSLTTAEALACGTPVAAAAAGGLTEVVDDGETGLVVAPGDSAQLAAALRMLLDDPRQRERMGSAAAKAARSRFDRDRMVADLHAFCSDVWRSRGMGAAGFEPAASRV